MQADQTVSNGRASTSVLSATQQVVGQTTYSENNSHQNTNFDNDAAERIEQPFPIHNYDVKSLDGTQIYDKDSVIQFLKTPILIRNFTIASTGTANTTLDSFTLPFDSTNAGSSVGSTGQYMWLNRLNAYAGFRATAIVKFQVNVNRFAQGRMLIHYIPGQNEYSTTNIAHRFNLMTKSQTPNMQINLNRDTSTEFRIPYVSAYPAYDLTRSNGTGDMALTNGIMGKLYSVIYSPLVGTTSVNVNIWLSFEDVELILPTYAPQGKEENISDRELKSGFISQPLSIVSKAAGVLSTIPALSSYMKTAAWVTRAMANTASSWGFAKPDIESNILRVNANPNPYMVNGDGFISSSKFGMTATNKLDVLPGFAGNDLDEMSLEYVANRPAYVGNANWAGTAVYGDTITSLSLSPSTLVTTTAVASEVVTTYTPFSFMSTFFGYWRADFVVTLKVIKTEFHTGKLDVTFRPYGNTNASSTTSHYLMREIVDLKESDTFIFTIPYASLTPFRAYTETIGRFCVNVANPLQAPSSVSSDVAIIIEVSAKNVSFSNPSTVQHYVASGTNAVFTPQGFEEEQTREKMFTLGNANPSEKRIQSARFVSGEIVNSFKQILNRFSGLRMSAWSSASTTLSFRIRPFATQGAFENAGAFTYYPMSGDHFAAISACYVLSRGGVRYHMATSSSTDFFWSYGYDTDNSGATNVCDVGTSRTSYVNCEQYLNKTVIGNSGLVTVNQFGYTHSRETGIVFTNTPSAIPLGEQSGFLTASWYTAMNLSTTARVSRSAADDYQLGFFIGVPTMITKYTAATY